MADANDTDTQAAAPRRLITIFGGTGFLGRRVVRHLLGHNFEVRAASRHPERIASIFEPGKPGPHAVKADVHSEAEVAAALDGCYGVVNAVSLYVERSGDTFRDVHIDAAVRVARIARDAGVEHLAHISGIGADAESSSRYIRARGAGEQAVQRAFANTTLIRPSVMFGPDDAFVTTLVKMVRLLPVLPMFGSGKTKLQPVYVEDVAEGVTRALLSTPGLRRACYEFGGPQIYTYEELLRTVARTVGARPRLIPMPFALWHAAARIAEYVPGAPLTRDQIALMQSDNVASPHLPGLAELGIQPTPIDAVLQQFRGQE
jgi:uncharacterized protein YbjT (DUF2867 family)